VVPLSAILKARKLGDSSGRRCWGRTQQLDEDRVHEGHNNVVVHDIDDVVNYNEDTPTKITDDDVVVQQGATTVTFVVGEMHTL
jgi:hypothetical protein